MNNVLVVIPTYNEIQNISLIINSIFSLYSKINILVIDDNSPDGTPYKVKELKNIYKSNLHLIIRKNKFGLGSAYIFAFKWAIKKDYEYIISMDADLSHDPKEIPKLLNPVKKGYDFSVGSRYIDGINVVNWPLKRILLSRMAAIYVRLITWMNIKDPTSGFVCYKSYALKKINIDNINSNGYAFQIETKFKLFSKRFKYAEVPIVFTDRKFGKSKLDSSIIGEAFIRVILIKLQSFFKLNK